MKPAEDLAALRQQLRQFIADNLPPDLRTAPPGSAAREEALARWRDSLLASGLLAADWPLELGGSGFTGEQHAVLGDEFAKSDAPMGGRHDKVGTLVGSLLLACGSLEQQQAYLPRVLSGADVWCLGFSEPGAGSDLAGLSCRAVANGSEWVINGQKIWTSQGHHANLMTLLARTDPDQPRHRGISLLIVDLRQPGVEVRPIRMITGGSEFAEVFFTDAKAPLENVIGTAGSGWQPAMQMMRLGRGGDQFIRIPRQFRSHLDRLIALARETGAAANDDIRQRLARCECSVTAMQSLADRIIAGRGAGRDVNVGASVFKLYWSEYHKVVASLAMDMLGLSAIVPAGRWPAAWSPDAGPAAALDPDGAGLYGDTGSWITDFLVSQSGTIYGGTSQIQRTIIGEAALGLPKEPARP
jgi:alkylation response protein AidB-like acyl-CoA dehydrogenase